MKKTKKFISITMAALMMFSCFGNMASAADLSDVKQTVSDTFEKVVTKAFDFIVNGLLSAVSLPIRDNPSFTSEEDYESKNFYDGTDEFLDTASENATWRLGSSTVSLVPEDILEKDYYLGGFIMLENWFTNRVEEVVDDMCARVIAIDDASGRGVSLFATVDCIGMTNKDIKEIRALVAQRFAQEYPEVEIASINVSSTHTHSCIDTEGLWTNLIPKVFKNLAAGLFGSDMEYGADREYMSFLFEKVSDAMLDAYDSMKTGTLTYATKDIGAEYFSNKNRSSASTIITDLTRLVFTPDDNSKATIIANVGAHPDVAGLPMTDDVNKGRSLSGDYIYYMGEYINKAGYNFMFFNGAICGIYIGRGPTNDSQDMEARWEQSRRYGYELAKITLALTKTESEIKADAVLYDTDEIAAEMEVAEKNQGEYSLWCENWIPVSEIVVEPIFNIRISQVEIAVTNPLILTAGKLNLANYDVIKTEDGYKIYAEIGYAEFGNQLRVAMVPGEFCADLVKGGTSLTAEGSATGEAFSAPTLYDLFGDITVFGLANDAIGYIVPDNDYSMAIIYDHYQEMISIGENTASSIMNGFAEIADKVK